MLGKASNQAKDEFQFVIEARRVTLDLLKPANRASDVFAEYNTFMRANRRPEEARLYAHGQGYDMVERPLIRQDEPLSLAASMNIVVHPTYIAEGFLNWACDNYEIAANGPGLRMHKLPEQIVELDL